MISVIVADANRVIQIGIRSALEEKQGFAIVAEAGTLPALTAAAASSRFDVVLIELGFLRNLGKPALVDFLRTYPDARLLINNYEHPMTCGADVLALGASGYVTKDCSPSELRIAVSTVANGQPYISAGFAKFLGETFFRASNVSGIYLSPKETKVFKMLTIGMQMKGISAQTGLSERAVSALKSRIAVKMSRPELDELTRFAVSRGFI